MRTTLGTGEHPSADRVELDIDPAARRVHLRREQDAIADPILPDEAIDREVAAHPAGGEGTVDRDHVSPAEDVEHVSVSRPEVSEQVGLQPQRGDDGAGLGGEEVASTVLTYELVS